MTPTEIAKLKKENIEVLRPMETNAGTTIQLIIDGISLKGNNFIRLSDATEYRVYYELVEGDQAVLEKVAARYGVELTDITLEVLH